MAHSPSSGAHPGHLHAHPTPQQAARRLAWTFAVTATIGVAELLGGLVSGSLALLADAGHMLFDLLALGVALVSLRVSSRPADATHTWGFRRVEVLGALVNGLLLIGVSVGIALEAVARFRTPEPVDVSTMLSVAAVGLLANLVSLAILGGCHGSLGVRGALLHVLGDTLSSVGVLVGGAVIAYTGQVRIDAALSALIALVLSISSLKLLREVAHILLEAAPKDVDTQALRAAMAEVPGVALVHDMHLWSITTGVQALSAHVVLAAPGDGHGVRAAIEAMLTERFAIVHTTLQMEPPEGLPGAPSDSGAPCAPWRTRA